MPDRRPVLVLRRCNLAGLRPRTRSWMAGHFKLRAVFAQALSNHAMKIIRTRDFLPAKAWQALDIANIQGTTIRLHWTDQPYKWHVNDGEEVFAVLSGEVNMHYRESGKERIAHLTTGDVFYASVGCEHVAHPVGAAHVLVVEREGSV